MRRKRSKTITKNRTFLKKYATIVTKLNALIFVNLIAKEASILNVRIELNKGKAHLLIVNIQSS